MSKLNGTLDNTSLPEILRTCSVQQKTGTLNLTHAGINKKLYFDKGRLIYITSNKSGERVGEYLIQRGDLTRSWAGFLLKDSQRNGIAFTQSLLQKNIFDQQQLQKALSDLAATALADAMNWTSGSFDFSNNVPQQALEGPIQISEAEALQIALKNGENNKNSTSSDQILRELARQIAADNFTLPLLPTSAAKLANFWKHGDQLAENVLQLAHRDQILTANLLRVVNASIGQPAENCATLKQATERYPQELLLGIVLAQGASAQAPKQPDTVSQLLQHALRCACLAQQIAGQLGEDEELAYTCGLLHNIGKVLLLQLLNEDNTPPGQLAKLVQQFHQNSGALLSRRWNLSPQLHDCIKYYRIPEQAQENQRAVEIVHLSHNLLLNQGDEGIYHQRCPNLNFKRLDLAALTNNLELIDELVDATF